MRLFCPVVLTLLMVAFAGAAAAQAASHELMLGPGDAVRLHVGDEPTLGGDFPVTEEGVALLPLIGVVRVVGRPFAEVRADVEEAYRGKLAGTPIMVTPVLRIAVLGEVRQPGLVPVDPTFTVADVLAAAGGITPLGNPSRITLIRLTGTVRFSLDRIDILEEALLPGDQIVVARRGWIRENVGVLLGAGASVVAAALTTLLLR